jgi:Fe-S cluster biogenesis protein NfuA
MQAQQEQKICKTCFMKLPDIHIHDDECIFCKNYKGKWAIRDYEAKEKELKNILDFYKQKHKHDKYDCIVPVSGGKDSTYVLFLAVKKFGLRPLAVNFNNGIRTELAKRNIDKAVEKLNVELVTIAPDEKELQAMYRHFFIKTGNMCTVCNHMINTTVINAAAEHGISLILVGGVNKLELAPIYGNKRYCMEEVFKAVLANEMDFDISKYLNKPIRLRNNIEFITLFNYIDYDYNIVLKTLKDELDWRESLHGDSKIDCQYYPVISYFKYIKNSVSSSILSSSALLRDNKISKDEYNSRITKIKKEFSEIDDNDINKFYEYLEIGENDISGQKHILDYVTPVIDYTELEKLRSSEAYSSLNDREKIEKLLDYIQPEINRDGGFIKIRDFIDNELILELDGECRSCLQADDTMIPHIESLIKEFVSDDIFVERYIGIV